MWICRICEHKSGRRGNIIRHMKLVHSIDDRDCKNAYNDSNKTSRIPSCGGSRKDTPVCSNGLQSRMMGSGKQSSEERYSSMISPEPMTELQDGGYLPRHQPRMDEEDELVSNPVNGLYSSEQIENWGNDLRRKKCHILDCVLDTFPDNDSNETSRIPSCGGSRKDTPVCSNGLQSRMMGSGKQSSEERYSSMISPEPMTELQDGGYLPRHQPRMDEEDELGSNPVNGLYSSEQIENWGNDLRRKKRHILDCVLDTFPEHLKTKAKSMCDTLKCKDRLFILPSHEIVIDGEVDRGSNIRDYIMDSLIEPPVPGTPKFTLLEKENERLKCNLAYYEKALAKARGLSRCRKFEIYNRRNCRPLRL